jgi:hypothetical protein
MIWIRTNVKSAPRAAINIVESVENFRVRLRHADDVWIDLDAGTAHPCMVPVEMRVGIVFFQRLSQFLSWSVDRFSSRLSVERVGTPCTTHSRTE